MPNVVTIIWSSRVWDKVSERGIDPNEVDDVLRFPESEGVSASSGRPIAFGTTAGGDYIAVVYDIDEDETVAVVRTAYIPGL